MQLEGTFEDLLSTLGEDLSNPLDWMTVIADGVVEQLKNQAPVAPRNGGALKASIDFSIVGNTIQFGMANYGVFQNYGVRGVDKSRSPVINAGSFGITIDGYPVTGEFQFGTKNYGEGPGWGAYYTGLRAYKGRGWFNIQQLSDGLADATLKALNLE